MRRNIETKARATDLEGAAAALEAAGARFVARLDQRDTYFAVTKGRLKVRESSERRADGCAVEAAELIRYDRPDEAGARVSEYRLERIADPAAVLARLEREHGVRGIVVKCRDLWLYGDTRIHLDRVEGLGDFVELETVAAGHPTERHRAEHEQVVAILAIAPGETIPGSYIDVLAGNQGS